MEKGYIQLYTGDGKGKTTAALGLCVRALGREKRVALIPFYKNGESGEYALLKKMGLFMDCDLAPNQPPWDRDAKTLWTAHTKKQWEKAKRILQEGIDVLVLDEIMIALRKEDISYEEMMGFLQEKPKEMEIILTGRDAPEWIVKCADLVTEMKAIKHYYQQGVQARLGIEY